MSQPAPPTPRSPRERTDGRVLASARNPTEEWLLALWGELLGRGDLGIHDGFFEAGGSPALAIRLFTRIERDLGRSIPPSALFGSPTPALLADRIDDEEIIAPDVLVPLCTRSGGPPLVFVPDVEGHVFGFRESARRLGDRFAVHGLQTQNLFGNALALASVESLTESCLDALRRAGIRGPVHLVGHRFGGLVAWEMACRLARRRSPVALVALLDTEPPGTPRRPPLVRFRNRFRTLRRRRGWESRLELVRDHARTRLEPWAWTLRAWRDRVAGREYSLVSRLETVRTRFRDAAARYQPGRYDGEVTLFRSRHDDRQSGHTLDEAGTWLAIARAVRVLRADCSGPDRSGEPAPEIVALLERELGLPAEHGTPR